MMTHQNLLFGIFLGVIFIENYALDTKGKIIPGNKNSNNSRKSHNLTLLLLLIFRNNLEFTFKLELNFYRWNMKFFK